ncbi:NADH-cytochrome b5 reductase 2 [Exophiala dermatitidis]
MATYLRPSVRVAAVAAAGAGLAYAGYQYRNNASSLFNTAHAESLPSDAQAALKKMQWKGFTELKLESAEMVNHNVRRLTFALPDDQSITGLAPITSLLTRHTPEGAWIPVFRPYTPISDNDQAGTVTFMVKKYPNGKGSGKMHSLKPGETLLFKPLHEFDYKPNQFSAMTFIAGGSGITPIYQLTRVILKNPEDKTKIALVYANNSEEDILLKNEFDELEKKYPGRFSRIYTISKTTPQNEGLYEKGYVTKEILNKVMPQKASERSVKVLVSGPPAMVESVAGAKGGFGWTQGSLGGILKELGYTKEEVHKF